MTTILGIDIGGTGIKGAPVDLDKGTLAADRFRIPTPSGGSPGDVARVVGEIVAHFEGLCPDNPVLYVIQTHQNLVPDSLADLERSFEWSRVTIYNINEEGMKHGAILGANRWQPSSPR